MVNEQTPLVSVVLPTHNRAGLLGSAIRSVLAQTYYNLELIVVDDASEDCTSEVVESFTDDRLRYIGLGRSHHVSAARNIGIRCASGSLISFQDDDDIWLVEKLAKQVTALLNGPEDVGLNLCSYIRISDDREVKYFGGEKLFENVQPRNGYCSNLGLIATPGWLVKADILKRSGLFDERLKTLEDWELSLRISEHCKFTHIDEPLLIKALIDARNLSKREDLFSVSLKIIMERHAGKWADRPRILAYHNYLIGRLHCYYGSAREGRSWLKQAVAERPIYLKAWLVYVGSFFSRSAILRIARLVRFVRGRLTDILPRKN